jgi:hypothetical protein
VRHSGWYQVPVLYGWWDVTVSGGIETGKREPAADTAERHANGAPVGDIA